MFIKLYLLSLFYYSNSCKIEYYIVYLQVDSELGGMVFNISCEVVRPMPDAILFYVLLKINSPLLVFLTYTFTSFMYTKLFLS